MHIVKSVIHLQFIFSKENPINYFSHEVLISSQAVKLMCMSSHKVTSNMQELVQNATKINMVKLEEKSQVSKEWVIYIS